MVANLHPFFSPQLSPDLWLIASTLGVANTNHLDEGACRNNR